TYAISPVLFPKIFCSVLQLHLNPIHAVVQLRPSMAHLDTGLQKKKHNAQSVELSTTNDNPMEESSGPSSRLGKLASVGSDEKIEDDEVRKINTIWAKDLIAATAASTSGSIQSPPCRGPWPQSVAPVAGLAVGGRPCKGPGHGRPPLLAEFTTKTQQERIERFYGIQSYHMQFKTNLSHENLGSVTTVGKPQREHHMRSGNQNKNQFPTQIKSSCKRLDREKAVKIEKIASCERLFYLGRSYLPVFQIWMERMKEVKRLPL
ncbi:hypothetical protein B296_00012699, partial [Ensete ventricosum]